MYSEINDITLNIAQLLKNKNKALIIQIKNTENLIDSNKKELKKNLEVLEKEEILIDFSFSEELELNKEVLINKIRETKNLDDLETTSREIFTELKIIEDKLDNVRDKFLKKVYKHFKEFKNIKSLNTLFKSLDMNNFAKLCDKYQNQLKKIYKRPEKLSFGNVIENLVQFKKRIEEGYEKSLEKKLDKESQNFYLKLNDLFGSKSWFSKKELSTVAENMNINEEKKDEVIQKLIDNEILEHRFYFKK